MRSHFHKTITFLYVLALMLLFCGSVEAVETLKKKYENKGPIDPDCPCYRYQKRAEREFRRANKKSKSKGDREIHKEKYRMVKKSFNLPIQTKQKRLSKRLKRQSGSAQKARLTHKFRFIGKEGINSCPKW